MKKLQNTVNRHGLGFLVFLLILICWQTVVALNFVPRFMLPAPTDIVQAFVSDLPLLMMHAKTTLIEAALGLSIGVSLGVLLAYLMDRYAICYRVMHPFIVLTQTVPTVAIAPLLVLWMGYGILPKITLIVLTSFFPITMGVFNGLQSVDKDQLKLMEMMHASPLQIYRHLKFPQTLSAFFGSLKISVSYAVVGAVVAEWLGGDSGLGVYMTRVRKAFAFDRMFAVIVLISLLSLGLMASVKLLERKLQPWRNTQQHKEKA